MRMTYDGCLSPISCRLGMILWEGANIVLEQVSEGPLWVKTSDHWSPKEHLTGTPLKALADHPL